MEQQSAAPDAMGDSEPFSPLRHRLLAWLEAAQKVYDRRGGTAFCVLLGLFSVLTWALSRPKPLWYDELLGLSAATAPHLQDVFSALAKPVDINPPLFHLLARVSISLLGYSAFAARLPAFLGMLAFLCCLFIFISRRLSASYGALGVLLVLCTPVSGYAFDARPYGIVLGLTGIAMVAYQRRAGQGGAVPLAVYCLACFCLPLTHYYATLVVGPFLAAEAVRAMGRKRMDWPLTLGTLIAPVVALYGLRGMIHSQKAALANYHSPGTIESFIPGSTLFATPAWVVCLGIAALALGNWLSAAREEEYGAAGKGFSGPETALAVSLLALPYVGVVATLFTHAYVGRYFMAAIAGYAVLGCSLAASLQRRCAGVPLLLSLAAMALLGHDLAVALKHRNDPPAISSQLQPLLDQNDLPLVFQDAKDYVLAREALPQSAARFHYAAEPELALKVTYTNTDDKLMLAMASLHPEQVARLNNMARKSQYWVVVPSAEGWLAPCLKRMGLEIRKLNTLSALKVRLPDAAEPVSWCEPVGGSTP